MLSAIALDDEIPALEVLESFASRNQTINLKAIFSKTSEALRYLKNNPIDLLFLDINMPAMSGIRICTSNRREYHYHFHNVLY